MGSLLFFVISNFGVWFLGNLYTPDLNGLINCYILAIPFFKNTIISPNPLLKQLPYMHVNKFLDKVKKVH